MDFPQVTSSLVRDAWAYHLADYPDRVFVDSLLHIIDFGASLGFIGDEKDQSCKNLTTAIQQPTTIQKDLSDLLSRSRIHGPFPSPPLPHFRCSPLGTVSRKRNPSKLRVIHHLSWPEGDSVNDGIPGAEGTISYERLPRSVDSVKDHLCQNLI